jgi:hypothetical protein
MSAGDLRRVRGGQAEGLGPARLGTAAMHDRLVALRDLRFTRQRGSASKTLLDHDGGFVGADRVPTRGAPEGLHHCHHYVTGNAAVIGSQPRGRSVESPDGRSGVKLLF